MDQITQEFISLIDRAIEVARREKMAKPHLMDSYRLAIKNLEALRVNTVSGKLPRPSGGAILGLKENIGEFDGDELSRIGLELDIYYRDKM